MEVKPWKCANGHALGQVQRNGSGIRRLSLYRKAVDLEKPGEMPEVMALVEGHVIDVKCSICAAVRTWVEGEEAMRELFEKVGR